MMCARVALDGHSRGRQRDDSIRSPSVLPEQGAIGHVNARIPGNPRREGSPGRTAVRAPESLVEHRLRFLRGAICDGRHIAATDTDGGMAVTGTNSRIVICPGERERTSGCSSGARTGRVPDQDRGYALCRQVTRGVGPGSAARTQPLWFAINLHVGAPHPLRTC